MANGFSDDVENRCYDHDEDDEKRYEETCKECPEHNKESTGMDINECQAKYCDGCQTDIIVYVLGWFVILVGIGTAGCVAGAGFAATATLDMLALAGCTGCFVFMTFQSEFIARRSRRAHMQQ